MAKNPFTLIDPALARAIEDLVFGPLWERDADPEMKTLTLSLVVHDHFGGSVWAADRWTEMFQRDVRSTASGALSSCN